MERYGCTPEEEETTSEYRAEFECPKEVDRWTIKININRLSGR